MSSTKENATDEDAAAGNREEEDEEAVKERKRIEGENVRLKVKRIEGHSQQETDALAQIQLLAMDIVNLQDKIGNIIDNNKERFVTN